MCRGTGRRERERQQEQRAEERDEFNAANEQAAASGDSEALFHNNRRLVFMVARRVVRQAECERDIDDLQQVGDIALWRASQHFDPERGFRFSTYACTCIRRAMWRWLKGERGRNRFWSFIENDDGSTTAQDVPCEFPTAVERVEETEHLTVMREELKRLPRLIEVSLERCNEGTLKISPRIRSGIETLRERVNQRFGNFMPPDVA